MAGEEEKVRFPDGMSVATTVKSTDKIMMADGDTNQTKVVNFNDAKQYLGITGIDLDPNLYPPGSALPTGPSDGNLKINPVSSGSYTWNGNIYTVPEGYTGTLFWNGSSWSLTTQELPVKPTSNVVVEGGTDATSQDAVYKYANPLFTRVDDVEGYLGFEDDYVFPIGVNVDVQELTLANTGDYIEFQARTDAENGGNTLRMFGTLTNSINALGFYNFVLRLRGNLNNDSWVEFTNLPTFDKYHKYRVEVNGTNWDLYVDGVLHQSRPKTSNFVFSNIGNAYNAASGDRPFYLKDKVTVRVSGQVTELTNFNELNSAVIKNRTGKLDDVVYRDVYVSFDPTGYSGREQFVVFLKKRGSTYVGINVIRQGNAGTDTNLFRINRAFEYTFNGTTMSQGTEVLTEGESEFTTLVSGANNGAHSGGAHGHEVYSVFKFYVDGEEINTANGGFSLRAANSAFYVQKSDILNGSSPMLEHYKRTDFFPAGYRTRNRIVGLVSPSVPMRFVYTGIVCIGNVNRVMDDYFNEANVIASDSDVLNNTGDETLNFYSSQRGLEITSRSITPGIEVDPRMYVQDRLSFNDCKYYRTNNGRSGDVSPIIPLNQGDKWEVECQVVFK